MEKERLYELFLITTEISRGLTAGNLKHIKQALKGFFGIQAYVIWTKDDGNWNLLLKDGKVRLNISDHSEISEAFEGISKNLVFHDWKTGTAPGDEVFEASYARLYIFLLL